MASIIDSAVIGPSPCGKLTFVVATNLSCDPISMNLSEKKFLFKKLFVKLILKGSYCY